MTQQPQSSQGFSLTPQDIVSIVFRHKWKIVLFSLLGLVGAWVVFTVKEPLYSSTARLLIRYVTEKRTPTAGGENGAEVIRSPDSYGNTVVNSEVQILSSEDLARLTARGIGPERILSHREGPAGETAAAAYIRDHLRVEVGRNSAVMTVTFSHPDPVVAREALEHLIKEYLIKHDEVHRAIGTYELILSQTGQLRSRLSQTEDELRKAKEKAGVTSIEFAEQEFNTRLGTLRASIDSTEAEVAQQRARIQEFTRSVLTDAASGEDGGTNSLSLPIAPDPIKVATYNRLGQELAAHRAREADLRFTFATESKTLQETRRRITETEAAIEELAIDPAALSSQVLTPEGGARPVFDLEFERANLAAAEAKLRIYNEQLQRVTAEASKLDAAATEIARLKRTKELEEDQYKYFQANLERARLDQTLDSGKLNNISPIQEPSAPTQDLGGLQKMLLIAFAGPIGFGFALAFALDLFLDPSVKRRRDLEGGALQLPVLTAIPYFGSNGDAKRRGRLAASDQAIVLAKGEISPWEEDEPMLPYFEALRDRIVMSYGEDPHKPKIIGVTSCHKGAGVTRVATGVAAALSRDAERNVLLIALERNKVAVSNFSKGRPAGEIGDQVPKDSINGPEDILVKENLYSLATTGRNLKGASIGQSFTDLMPHLKAGDYDYIVFDLPPLTETSGSIRLAGQMERTVLVVESEKTVKDSLRRAKEFLGSSQTHLAAVLNKTRSYGPRILQMGD